MKHPFLAAASFLLLITSGCGAAPGYEEYFGESHAQGTPAFHEALDPYGEWITHAELGELFCPADPNYQPYYAGTWQEKHGVYEWVSEEPIAWAVYHYGRWANLGGSEIQVQVRTESGQAISSWCWQPGNEWAASWVEFRVDERFDVVGWAPMAPVGWDVPFAGFRYVDIEDFFADDLVACYYEPREIRRISRRSVRVRPSRLRREHERRRRIRVTSRRRARPDPVALNVRRQRVPTPPVSAPLRDSRPSTSVFQSSRPRVAVPAGTATPFAADVRQTPAARPEVVRRRAPRRAAPPAHNRVSRRAVPRAAPVQRTVPRAAPQRARRVRARSHLDHPMTRPNSIPARRRAAPRRATPSRPSAPVAAPRVHSRQVQQPQPVQRPQRTRSSSSSSSSTSSSSSSSSRSSTRATTRVSSPIRAVVPSSSSSSRRTRVRVR